MRSACPTLAALSLLSVLSLSGATRIDDPKTFVTEVYRRFMAQSSRPPYTAPGDIYTPSLQKLFSNDKRKAQGEVGCLDFVFWLNAQDWKISNLTITSSADGPDRETVIAKFRNFREPQEMRFDFRRISSRWLL